MCIILGLRMAQGMEQRRATGHVREPAPQRSRRVSARGWHSTRCRPVHSSNALVCLEPTPAKVYSMCLVCEIESYTSHYKTKQLRADQIVGYISHPPRPHQSSVCP